MNNKGFTLVELLAVFIILLGIALIAVGGISSSLEKREERECENEIALAKNAAKIYFSLHDNVTSVSISTLKSEDYFNENSDISKLQLADTVTFSSSGYVFNGTGTCR